MTRVYGKNTPAPVITIALLVGWTCLQCTSDAFAPSAFLPNHSVFRHKLLSEEQVWNSAGHHRNRCDVVNSPPSSQTSLYADGANGLSTNEDDENDNNNNDKEEEEDDDDDEEEEESLYEQFAPSEFSTGDTDPGGQLTSPLSPDESIDWGGEYDTLRSRTSDSLSGRVGPPLALFRIMTTKNPNDSISDFVSTADPQVVEAMGGAVSSLLGGLANPAAGIETIVKANGEKLGNLCFQLQMTGYMFRNAEYVLAIRELMDIRGGATLEDYRTAFGRLDTDGSGYIESYEIEDLLSDVYDGEIPQYEVKAFIGFFDSNEDGRISWDEFEKGLGAVSSASADAAGRRRDDNGLTAALPGSTTDDDDDGSGDGDDIAVEPSVSGKVKIELKNGKVIEVEAREYIEQLKKEADALTEALQREKGRFQPQQQQQQPSVPGASSSSPDGSGKVDGIAGYIASLEGDFKSLTKGISSDVVESMKLLVEYVLDNGNKGPKTKSEKDRKEKEMEIPGAALQQLALWQLVVGYKLREAEATGDYRKMLEE